VDAFRFDKLHVKLFAAIGGAIAILAIAAYLVFTASFERGFVQYLNRSDESRLELMIDRLAEGYARERNWDWIATDRDGWIGMSRDALGLPRPPEDPAGGSATRHPPRDTPLTIDPRLMLFDSGRNQLIGRRDASSTAVLKPIVVDGSPAGYLGYVPRPEIIASIERVYLQRQRIAFAVIAVGMLAASLALAAGLAYWLTRRIRELEQGANSLIRGDYRVKIDVSGNDELARLARDFNTLARTLEASRLSRQQWIADISHELRTPLSILRAEIEAMQDGVRPLDQSSLESLANETQRFARLVEDLHTLSSSDLGALTYRKEAVDPAEVLSETIEAQQRAIRDSGLAMEMSLEPGARVLADETRLAQVFANLLQNSLRYTEAPGKIAIRLRRDGRQVVIDWEDSAPGVPAGDLTRLTDRLFRVEGSRSRDGGGSGLGLAIAQAIVAGHDGKLTARHSALGGLWIELVFPTAGGAMSHA
jgi:two-component system sensor histidine kinase BaeS